MALPQHAPAPGAADRLRRWPVRRRHPGDTGLPPGPRWPALVQSAALLRFRHRFVPWCHRRYGDRFTVRLVPGGRPVVFHTRPEQAREIFAGDPEVFHAGKANAILGPVMGPHSVLLVDGAEHRRVRRLLMPAFNAHALKGYRGLVTEVARAEIAGWRDGEELVSLQRMNRLTLEVILRVVFGVTDERRLGELRPLVNSIVDLPPHILLGWAFPRLQRLGPWRRVGARLRRLDLLIHEEIAEHRAAADLAERTDVLSTLIRVEEDGEGLTDAELRDQLVTLLLAGHETTATALAWTLHEIGSSRSMRERAATAAAEGDEGWLEAALKEGMRLHPVIAMVVRTLQRPTTVAGLDLPAGVTVGQSIIVSHARPESFPDPARFDPERFVGGAPAVNTWIPFGGGVRRCIGAGFAQMEGVEVLREVLTAFDIEAVGPERPAIRNITSVPARGARIRVTARGAA